MKRAWAVVPLFIVLVLLFLPKLFLVPSVTRAFFGAGLHTEVLSLKSRLPGAGAAWAHPSLTWLPGMLPWKEWPSPRWLR